jgi:hypothetical protein
MDDHTDSAPPSSQAAGAADQLRRELETVAAEAAARAKKARNLGRFWRLTHILLGLPAAVLAATAGGLALASSSARLPAAYLALASAVFASAVTFISSNERELHNNKLKSAWRLVETDARLALVQDGFVTADETFADLVKLHEQRKAIFIDQAPTVLSVIKADRRAECDQPTRSGPSLPLAPVRPLLSDDRESSPTAGDTPSRETPTDRPRGQEPPRPPESG